MAMFQNLTAGRVWVGDGNAMIISGTATTRAGVLAETGSEPAIGSRYLSTGTGGKQYVRVAKAGVEADWEKVTTSAAD